MIKNSFIFLPGIGEKREKSLWKDGYFSWYQLHDEIPKYLIRTKSKVTHICIRLKKLYKQKILISFYATYLLGNIGD